MATFIRDSRVSVTILPHLIFNYSKRIRLKQLFTIMIVIRTTLQTDSNRGRVKNLIFNRGRTPPFTGISGFFNRTTSVGDSFMFERENALATNCAWTTYYRTSGWRGSRKGSGRGSRRGSRSITFIFIWIVLAVTVTVTSIRRWNTFSRIGTFKLCWRTLNWNRGERLHALKSYAYNSLTKLHTVWSIEIVPRGSPTSQNINIQPQKEVRL